MKIAFPIAYRILAIIFFLYNASCQTLDFRKKVVELGNELYSKSFSGSSHASGQINVEILAKAPNKSLTRKACPYFEFVINGRLTTSQDQVWRFISDETRAMGNGGTEYKLKFHGVKDNVDGLVVTIIQQIFPKSTLVRERLELGALDNKSFSLTKLESKLHFEFPKYALYSSGSNSAKSTEIRIASWELKPITFKSINPKRDQNHMYYPNIRVKEFKDQLDVKGPINILAFSDISWITAYEHASQDNLKGLLNEGKISEDGKIVDAMQGTKGIFNFPISDEDFRFLEIRQKRKDNSFEVSTAIKRGGYLDGERIDGDNIYSTVWSATAFHKGGDVERSKEIIRNYLFNQICERPASRNSEFYYNTWGMQRADRTKPLRGILTYERIFEEIDRAAQLGVDIFVLDDGWEQTQGDWTPHKERLTEGLEPIKRKLDEYGIKMGIWLSPMGIDSTTERYKNHPEWVIKDSEGKPILAQWGHPAFDFVGPFSDVFIQDCKRLIDQGTRFFKWDAINTFYSSLPHLEHGSEIYSVEERRARYEYLLPIYVTRAMEILTDYEPELIIEMDVTEARRVMIGLAPLSHGKLFHMNNGASWYNDYTEFRTNSMRTIPNEYNGIIPLELFTFANYPHNLANSMDYNVNTSLIAGHGFWGDLSLTTEQERLLIGDKVAKSKMVLPYLTDIKTIIKGQVGTSPEIYRQINKDVCAGQIITFSNAACDFTEEIELDSSQFLAVLDHAYKFTQGKLILNFSFDHGALTDHAFILPNNRQGISIISSTSEIAHATLGKDQLNYTISSPGSQSILWSKAIGRPQIEKKLGLTYTLFKSDAYYMLKINSTKKSQSITIRGSN